MTPDERAAQLERLDMQVRAVGAALTALGELMEGAMAALLAALNDARSREDAEHIKAVCAIFARLRGLRHGMARGVLAMPEAQQQSEE